MKRINEKNLRNDRDAANILYANSLGGIGISCATAIGLVIGFPNEHIQHYKLWWLGLMCGLLFLRTLDWYFWRTRL